MANFCYHLDGIKVLGVPLGSTSFLQDMLNKYVCHLNTLLKLKDVQVAFGIFSQCFTKKLLPHSIFPLSTFWHQHVSFDMNIIQVFGCLLGPMFFIAHRHLWCTIKFFLSILLEHQPHFHRAHCANSLFVELNFYYTHYHY